MRTPLCAALLLALATAGCGRPSANAAYFGKLEPPEGQQMRYITGGEPESLDPQIGTGQPEARIYVGLFEGLTELDPKTAVAVPALAERWDITNNNTEFVFHLRRNARFSDGTPITARDFVYTVRRGLAPEMASRNSYMSYDILNAQAFNEGGAFVRDRATGAFVMNPDAPDQRLVVPTGEEEQGALAPAVARLVRGKEIVPVRAEDVGVEAIDDYTVAIHTARPVPFVPGLLSHQFFRVVPRQAIERYGSRWTQPGNLVSSGPYLLDTWQPYDRLILVPNPMYWDAASVRLQRITFYPLDEATTMMNLYKAGEVDGTYNHTVPAAWLDQIGGMKDYINLPEAATEYYSFNVTRPPMNDIRVRKAFNMAVDKVGLARFKRSVHPNTGFIPLNVFPGYPNAKGDEFNPERAKQLLAEAGYRDAAGNYAPSAFPVRDVELAYNTTESNRQTAEFLQAQFKQNLGLTVPLKNMEFRTFLPFRNRREYRGMARGGWIADYLDPFSFLDLFSTPEGNNASGWYDPAYVRLLRDANREPDPMRRFELLSRAEKLLLEAQPVIPLYTNDTSFMKKPYVKGLYGNPLTIHPWQHVYIEHDPSKWD